MGRVATRVSFWRADMPVGEVLEASSVDLFKVRNLKRFSKFDYDLERWDDGTYVARFDDGSFFRFKPIGGNNG